MSTRIRKKQRLEVEDQSLTGALGRYLVRDSQPKILDECSFLVEPEASLLLCYPFTLLALVFDIC